MKPQWLKRTSALSPYIFPLPPSATRLSNILLAHDFTWMLVIDWFSKNSLTSNDDVVTQGVVWIQLPEPMLTLSGQGCILFTTAIPLFSRCGHNVWIFVLFSSWKGKKKLSLYIKWYFMICFSKAFTGFWTDFGAFFFKFYG